MTSSNNFIAINNPSPASNELFGFSLASTGSNILIGAPEADGGNGVAYLYNNNGVLQQTLTNPSNVAGDEFGFAVKASGTAYLVGAPKFDGAVQDVGRVYRFNSDGTLQETFDNSVNNDDSEFGSAITILANGNFVIGAPEKGKVAPTDNAGQVRLFDGGTPTNIDYPEPVLLPDARFGSAVAAAGNNIIIGAPGYSLGTGQAFLYDISTGEFTQTFTNPNASPLLPDLFGISVASNEAGTLFLIGAPLESGTGAVYLYNNTSSTPLHTFTNPNPTNLGFGTSVTFIGNDILIGAPGTLTINSPTDITVTPSRGAVYQFDGDGASPTYQLEATISNPNTGNDGFGAAISVIDNNTFAVSAPFYDDSSNTDAGIAYIVIKETPVNQPNNNFFRGTSSADEVDGSETKDRLFGDAGNDTLNGGDGNDLVKGGYDNDSLSGGNGRDRVYGDAGNDTLFGGFGNDRLYGGAGDDLLDGGKGIDRVYGNTGSDTFVLRPGMGADTIFDFEDGVDLLQLNDGLTFADLDIIKRGSSTLIRIADTQETLVRLLRTDVELISALDFTILSD
jgi:Ca2+-binding RTX toxin-like protein